MKAWCNLLLKACTPPPPAHSQPHRTCSFVRSCSTCSCAAPSSACLACQGSGVQQGVNQAAHDDQSTICVVARTPPAAASHGSCGCRARSQVLQTSAYPHQPTQCGAHLHTLHCICARVLQPSQAARGGPVVNSQCNGAELSCSSFSAAIPSMQGMLCRRICSPTCQLSLRAYAGAAHASYATPAPIGPPPQAPACVSLLLPAPRAGSPPHPSASPSWKWGGKG